MTIKQYLSSGPTQMAYVTNHLDHAKSFLQETFGVEHFFESKGVETAHQQFRGAPAAVRMDVALAWTGSIFLEIIQPLTPDSPYAGLIQPTGFSLAFHHFAVDVPDWDEFLTQFQQEGRTLVYSAQATGFTQYGYWDLSDTLGHSIEFIHSTIAERRSSKPSRLASSRLRRLKANAG